MKFYDIFIFAIVSAVVLVIAVDAYAGSPLLRTEDDVRAHHNMMRYEKYQTFMNGSGKGITGAPLGGYYEPLGSPAPAGTYNYGYTYDKPCVYGVCN